MRLSLTKHATQALVAQVFQYLGTLLLLPFLLRYLSSDSLGMWYVFIAFSTLISFLELGFIPTLARNITYILSGAQTVRKIGFDENFGSDINYELLSVIVYSTRSLFYVLGGLGFLILGSFGSWFIWSKGVQANLNQILTMSSWFVFTLGVFTNITFRFQLGLIQGSGLTHQLYVVNAIVSIFNFSVASAMLYFNGGLLAVSTAYTLSALLNAILNYKVITSIEVLKNVKSGATISAAIVGGQVLWHNSWRLGLRTLGAFLVMRFNVLLASTFLSMSVTAAYAFTIQIFGVIQNISSILYNIGQVRISEYMHRRNYVAARSAVCRILIGTISIYLLMSALLYFFGSTVLAHLKANTSLVSDPILCIFIVFFFFEVINGFSTVILSTTNVIVFTKSALVTGIASVSINYIGLKYFGFGLLAMLSLQLLCQCFYNNWRWPLEVYKLFFYNCRT